MKILSVVGARPEFIQAMPVSRAIAALHQEILVHTGQHYDYKMSQQFFDELDVPSPHYNLGVGSASQAKQTAEIMVGMEEVALKENPDYVIVRGDTNSTIAAALVAAKLGIPFAHIEAGERSFNRRMPEEINRLVVDALADRHFCVSRLAVQHLREEGINRGVIQVGDVMLDSLKCTLPVARAKSRALQKLGIQPKKYSLVTIHRPANTDDPLRMKAIFSALSQTGETVILPMHPRTRKVIQSMQLQVSGGLRIIDPIGYLDMLSLEENARLIATDSGGVQREAYYMGLPCLTLRDETEWVETVEIGWNKLVGADAGMIMENWFSFAPPVDHPSIYGDGTAGLRIAEILNEIPC